MSAPTPEDKINYEPHPDNPAAYIVSKDKIIRNTSVSLEPAWKLPEDGKASEHKRILASFLRIARSHKNDMDMLPALADLEAYFEASNTALLQRVRREVPEKKTPSDPVHHNKWHMSEGKPATFDDDGEVISWGEIPTKTRTVRTPNDGYNQAIDDIHAALERIETDRKDNNG